MDNQCQDFYSGKKTRKFCIFAKEAQTCLGLLKWKSGRSCKQLTRFNWFNRKILVLTQYCLFFLTRKDTTI